MKALIIGHSYVRDLRSFLKHESEVILPTGNSVELVYSFVPGATFETFLDRPEILDNSVYLNPDIVIVILGGNDLKSDVDLSFVKDKCYHFFKILKSKFPEAILIGSQIESRFVEHEDKYARFGTPHTEEFNRLSTYFNSWLNKQKFKDRLFCIRGPNKLDNRLFYKDSVHLNEKGLEKYVELLKICLDNTCVKYFQN